MYKWNDLKICIESDKKTQSFISGIRNYFYANHIKSESKVCDIAVSICDSGRNYVPDIDQYAMLVNSYDLFVEEEINLKIYSYNEQLWYLYQDLAEIWIDFKNNKIIVSLNKKQFLFSYYNILFFFLYPLSMLLENFGYFRAHSSCVNIGEKSILFTGESGAGKSTSAFAIAANQGAIISDDMTFIKKNKNHYSAHTITRLVKLRTDILKFFPKLLESESLTNIEEERYFDVKNINKIFPRSSSLSAIIILEKTGKQKTKVDNIHPLKVVPHLFPSSLRTSVEKFTNREFIFFTDLLSNVNCYKVYFGTDMTDFYDTIKNVIPI
ncbi:MAG: hypothetical protein ACYCXK_04125 [Candidatus Humimicrobiaceae bacterium]